MKIAKNYKREVIDIWIMFWTGPRSDQLEFGIKSYRGFAGTVIRISLLCSDIDFKLDFYKNNEWIREIFHNKSFRLLNYISHEPKIGSIEVLDQNLWGKY